MDIELLAGFLLGFCLGMLFLVMARSSGKVVDKSFLYTGSSVIFFVLTPLYVVMEQTYAFIGFIFLVPAVYAALFAGQSFFQLYKKSSMDDWQKQDGDEEGEP